MLELLRRLLWTLALCLGLAGVAQAQDSPCDYALKNWRAYGENSGASAARFVMDDTGVAGPAYAYLASSNHVTQVLTSCPPARAPFTNEKISETVRQAAKSFFFCSQLAGPSPAPLSRIDFLKTYVREKKSAPTAPVTSVEVAGFGLNASEYTYWDARLNDLGSNAACADAIKLPELRTKMADLKGDLALTDGRIKTALQACQTDARAYQSGAATLAQAGKPAAEAITARTTLAPQRDKALKTCEPFAEGVAQIKQMGEQLDLELARRVPACMAIMQTAEPAYKAAQTAEQTRDTRAAATALTGFQTALAAATRDCPDYPGYLQHLKNVSALVSEIKATGK